MPSSARPSRGMRLRRNSNENPNESEAENKQDLDSPELMEVDEVQSPVSPEPTTSRRSARISRTGAPPQAAIIASGMTRTRRTRSGETAPDPGAIKAPDPKTTRGLRRKRAESSDENGSGNRRRAPATRVRLASRRTRNAESSDENTHGQQIQSLESSDENSEETQDLPVTRTRVSASRQSAGTSLRASSTLRTRASRNSALRSRASRPASLRTRAPSLRHSSSSALSPSQASAAEPEIQPQSADEHSPIKQHEPTKTRSTSRHKHIVENSDENTVENTDASLPAPVPQTPISKVSTSKTQTLRTASLRSRASSLRQSLVSSPSASSPARASTAEPPAEPQGTDERTLLKRDIPSAKTRAATLQSNVENSDEDTEDSQDVPFTGSRAPPLSSKVSVQKPRTSRPSDLRSRTPSAQQSHGVSSGGLNSPQVSTAEPRSEGTPSAQSSTSQASMPTSSSILQTPSSIKHSKINPPSPSVKSPAQANADVRELSQPIRSTQPDAAQGSQRLPPIVVKTRTYALSQQSQENRPPKPRMVIVRLVMTNFKSYAGRQEVGPFHPSFSSVVGPNGSGKSNVIDSLLFVFGFRASKMRQGKISALIHNSGAFSNLDHCEVQVCFQEILDLPQGKYSVIENSELVISRRAFKNNSSKYYINGRTSDYKEVTTLLRSRGIDLDHKRFLILQGEVESIAQMKPKAQGEHDDGLLEYLEDIIGTSQYKKPIEESINQAEELNEVCAEKKNRVKLVEKEMESLEDKKTLALQFINTENQIAMEKCALYQCSLAEDNNNVQLAADMITQLQSQFDAELEKHRGSEEEIEKLKKQTKQAETNIKEIERETEAILRVKKKADHNIVKSHEKEKFFNSEQKKLQKSIRTNELEMSQATADIEKHTADCARFAKEAARITEDLQIEETKLEEIRDNLKEKTRGFSDQVAAKQKKLEPWTEKINSKQSTIAVANSELEILHNKSNASRIALEEAQAKIATIEETRVTKQVELKGCQKEKAKLENERSRLQTEIEEMANRETELKVNLSGARQKADDAKSSMAASRSQSKVLSSLMRMKESGRIEGFHGRLGNLGSIDAKYDVAMSTGCPQLDHMVVDTVECAQMCLDYLRKNNLGRGTFICLDKLQKNINRIQTPENASRLFDLITPKDKIYLPAFYSVLRDTLVAKDLAQANRIAFSDRTRYRVATLDGKLIEMSGAMTGGGTTVFKGRMSSKQVSDVTQDVLTKLEKARDVKEKEFATCVDQQRELLSQLRDLDGRIPELDVTMSKIQLEIESSVKHLADAKRRINELGQDTGSSDIDKGRVNALEKQIKSLEAEIEKDRSETAGLQEEIQFLHDKIMEAGGIQLRSQKSKVDDLREQLDTVNEQISAANLGRTKGEKKKAKSKKTATAAREELETNVQHLEELQNEMSEHKKSAKESAEKAEEAQEYCESQREKFAELKHTLEERLTELNKSRAAEIEMKNKLEEHHNNLRCAQGRKKHWKEELKKLTLQNIRDLSGEEQEEGQEPLEFQQFTEDEIADMDKGALQKTITELEEQIKNVNIDISVLADYRRRVQEHAARDADLREAVANRDAVKNRLDDFRKKRLEEFMEGFNTISLHLKEMYQMITMGGNAELELVDSLDPFSEGILFSVMPPKKSWKNISNLSGGEKTLSSLALVFALHHYKPTPLYVMDEIDAALDFRNVSIVASYIKERTKNAQFIVISLRNNMFELASRLVGVYKVNHMTKSVTIENKSYIEDAPSRSSAAV